MPRVWMAIPIGGTAPAVEPYRDSPRELEQRVREVVEAEGADLENLYFEVDRPVAYALVAGLDDFRGIRAVRRVLGVEEAVKILDVQQAIEAIDREQAILRRFSL